MAAPRDKKKHHSVLRLVVDGGNRIDLIKKRTGTPEYSQYEMFACSNAILYVDVKDVDFSEIKKIVTRHSIHHILDLREVPYLNFGRSSRDSFFLWLSCHSVDYLSMVSVAAQLNKSSVEELLDDDACVTDLNNDLSVWLGNGPTLIFLGQSRDHDPLVARFTSFLKKTDVNYSELPST